MASVVLLVLLFVSVVGSNYVNDYDKPFTFQCPSGYVNDWDRPFTFQCPGHGVISGISSYHQNKYEDRRFKFYCCTLNRKRLGTCRFTDYVTYWDSPFNYKVPAGHVLRGASSHHDNRREDRRWKFETCTVR